MTETIVSKIPQIEQILERLVEARVGAGLSKLQAAKLLIHHPETISHFETGALSIDLPLFLKMCEVYDISPVWALTGVNPDFDEQAFDSLTQGVNASIEDLYTLKETLKRLSYGKDGE